MIAGSLNAGLSASKMRAFAMLLLPHSAHPVCYLYRARMSPSDTLRFVARNRKGSADTGALDTGNE